MSFSCEHCGFSNNEIQPGGQIQEKGIRITLQVSCIGDLNRQVVKSDSTSVYIPEVLFEIPAFSQKGGAFQSVCYGFSSRQSIATFHCSCLLFFPEEVTTIEGVLDRSIQGLEQDQVKRRCENPETAAQIDEFLLRLRNLKDLKSPFSMVWNLQILSQYKINEDGLIL